MVKAWQAVIVILGVWAVGASFTTPVEAQLDTFFYVDTCPEVYSIVAKGVYDSIQNLTRNAAFLLRLNFHDCFVQGCDGSILLDSTATTISEQFSLANNNSIGGLDVINAIKATIESSCPGVVSCADIITLSAFYSVVLSGGPTWAVTLGRRDALSSPNTTGTGGPLPSPNGNFTTNEGKFLSQNLTDQDLVVLSGAHTIGLSRCVTLLTRVYNFTTDPSGPDPTINTTLLADLESICPFDGNGSVTTVMDLVTPTVFDNQYFIGLLEGNGLFQTDQDLLDRGNNETETLVELYARDQDQFFEDFGTSMITMNKLNVSTGTEGEIRLNCSVANPTSSVLEQVVDWVLEYTGEKPKVEEKRRPAGKAGNLKRTDNVKEFFDEVLKLVAEMVAEEQGERLVEDSVTWGHSSM